LLRYAHEKSSGSDYTIWMDMFNSFINDTTLIDVIRGGSRFTSTNKQANPIGSVLDRVFVSREWGQNFLKVKVFTLTRVCLDHYPFLMEDGTNLRGFLDLRQLGFHTRISRST
jgi:hypothetical protein